MEAELGLYISIVFNIDSSQMILKCPFHVTRKLNFLQVGILHRLKIRSKAIKRCPQKPISGTRNKHVTQYDRGNLQTDMEYIYVTLVDKLNSRRGVCSILLYMYIHW